MFSQTLIQSEPTTPTSQLTLSDHLITLAQIADRAGYTSTARRLISLACSVFDETVQPAH